MQNLRVTSIFKSLAALLFLGIIVGVGIFAFRFYVREEAKALLVHSVEETGLEHFTYRRLTYQGDQLILFGVSLDEDQFHTIERVTLSYTPWHLLQEGRFQSLTLLKPSVTLHWDDLARAKDFPLPALPLDRVEVDDGEISFLTPAQGVFLFEYDALLETQEDGYLLSGQYQSPQPDFAVHGSLRGSLLYDQDSLITVSLEGLEYESKDLKLSRSNGEMQALINRDDLAQSEVSLEMLAGQALLYGFPWSNTNISAQYNADGKQNLALLVSGKAPNDPATEFTYSYERSGEEIQNSGTLYSEDGSAFYQYLNRSNVFILDPDDQPLIYEMESIEIPFEFQPGERLFTYHLQKNETATPITREVILPKSP